MTGWRLVGVHHVQLAMPPGEEESEAGAYVTDDTQLEGHDRAYVRDPFGNRLELIEETV